MYLKKLRRVSEKITFVTEKFEIGKGVRNFYATVRNTPLFDKKD